MKKSELVSIGSSYIDFNSPNFPIPQSGLQPGAEVVGSDYVVESGGSAVNFARFCSNLEIPTTFIGKVGKDLLGKTLSEMLIADQVQPLLIESDQVSTNVSFNMGGKEGDAAMAVVGTANQSFTAEELYDRASEVIQDSSYLYLGSCFKLASLMPSFSKLAVDAKAAGTLVVIDHGRITDDVIEQSKQTVRELVFKSDIYLPSAEEFLTLWGVTTIEDGIHSLYEKGFSGVVIVKDGKRGVATSIDGFDVDVKAYNVMPINTVGAGDSFNAGFIAAQYKGKELLESIKYGCATAALKISQSELPNLCSVKEFISKNDYSK